MIRPSPHPIDTIVAAGQCMGCGFCAATMKASNDGLAVSMQQSPEDGTYTPQVHGWLPGDDPGNFICPGTAMDMPALAEGVWGHLPELSMLGETLHTAAAYSLQASERKLSASGGVVPALLRMLFENGDIARAYVLGTDPGKRDGSGRIITNMEQFSVAHGSHYHPFDFGAELRRLLSERGRFAFVGLPCHVAAMRQVMRESDPVRQDCVVLISLFCGGINSFRGVSYYLGRHGIKPSDVATIGYRHGNWPGKIRVVLKDSSERIISRVRGNSRVSVMHYMAAFQGFWMLKRCRICPDQVGDFSDISVGDPHSRRFRDMSSKSDGGGFSAVVIRSAGGLALFNRASEAGYLASLPFTVEEVIQSQGYTLIQRRHADHYAKVERQSGGNPPLITTYPAFSGKANRAIRRIAYIDLTKIRLDLRRPAGSLVWIWQAFEYVALRFPLSGVLRRGFALLRNR
jgi:coenzyme F420 hydrogenase subunit beta